MSYIFSRALVEAYLEASCSDSAPFALSNLNPIPQAYCSPDRMTAYSRLSRFGMTYAPLTDDRGAALLTWYLEASRARTFQPQEKAPALTAPAPASGGKCTELSMRYDRNSHSWKTHLCLWDEDLPESSVILPKSGTMRNGLCWERTMWEPRTSESASGYLVWIGTPTASGKKRSEKLRVGNKLPNPYEFVEMFPSPLASDHKRRGPNSRQQGLPEFVRMFPTPRTKGMCGGTGSFRKMKDLEAKGIISSEERRQMTAGSGGQLNPTWVEWLMGWPLEWTALKPLATDKYRLWQQLHSGFCLADSKKERRGMKAILDACCGSRMFWFDRRHPDVVFMDRREETHTLCDGRTLEIKPDVVGDFREMPFSDGTFRLVVFDPPHLIHAGESSWLAKKYGKLDQKTWREDLKSGFRECFRVLEPGGVLVFKWCEDQVSTAEVLKLASHEPLFGHRRGKTVFLVFMKSTTPN